MTDPIWTHLRNGPPYDSVSLWYEALWHVTFIHIPDAMAAQKCVNASDIPFLGKMPNLCFTGRIILPYCILQASVNMLCKIHSYFPGHYSSLISH
ncbi:hypothetical protein TNCV_2680821 [Trichonephila clavipes]|uniref:Uncharacterized protein n=1 Tax=Trichonephila clavipes TaxID=2585209 RepID=A0A8X6VHK2_TRICX|nr:hypothetical protein TNCV_2680821 [Trichonephila clavipes]